MPFGGVYTELAEVLRMTLNGLWIEVRSSELISDLPYL
jgi:hypothetical protein